MLGAIVGDVVGSRFKWDNLKSKEFELFKPPCHATDDSVMTIAIGNALLKAATAPPEKLAQTTVMSMRILGRAYHGPNYDYGGMFYQWLYEKDPKPYNSFGNGAAMRVSGCAYAGDSLEAVLNLAHTVTAVTHNHPDGIAGAQATAGAIYLARTGASKDEIRKFVQDNYYDLNFTIDGIRPTYTFQGSCKGTVPQAVVAFLEGNDFEDTIRNAISIGGDSDTLAAIAGSIAEPFFGISREIGDTALSYLDTPLLKLFCEFEKTFIFPKQPKK